MEEGRLQENRHVGMWGLGRPALAAAISLKHQHGQCKLTIALSRLVRACHLNPNRKFKNRPENPTTLRKWARSHFAGIATSSESSAVEDDVEEESAAEEPDAGIMYSYDAVRGPAGGSQVLDSAIAQAVERFENRQTEKLVKEYEFVDGEDGYAADTDEDDFEIIDGRSFR